MADPDPKLVALRKKLARMVAPADATDTSGGRASTLEDLAEAQDTRSQSNLWKGFFGGYQSDAKAQAQTDLGKSQADSAATNKARAKALRDGGR